MTKSFYWQNKFNFVVKITNARSAAGGGHARSAQGQFDGPPSPCHQLLIVPGQIPRFQDTKCQKEGEQGNAGSEHGDIDCQPKNFGKKVNFDKKKL